MAEGKNDTAGDSDDEVDEKAINFPWSMEYVNAALHHVRKECEDDIAIAKAVDRSTASARDLLRLANNAVLPETEPIHQYLKSFTKPKQDSNKEVDVLKTHRSAATFEHENWDRIKARWLEWRKRLVADNKSTPTKEQHAIITCVHLRTKYEFCG